MNRLYKVVFNRARGQYVVCGEHSKTHTKSKALKAVVFSAALGLSAITGSAFAADVYSIYDSTNVSKTSDVTLVREEPTSETNYKINAYHTGDSQTLANRLTATNNSVTPKIVTKSIPMSSTVSGSNDVALYYNTSILNDAVSSDLKLNALGVTARGLYGVYTNTANASVTVENVFVDAKNSDLYGVFGAQAYSGSSLAVNKNVNIDLTGTNSDYVYGGYAQQGSSLAVNKNVNIDLTGTNSLHVYGGYAQQDSSLTVKNIDVKLDNSIVGSYVYGGYALSSSTYTQTGSVNVKVLNSQSRAVVGLYTSGSYVNMKGSDDSIGSVNVLIKDLLNNSSNMTSNVAGVLGGVTKNGDDNSQIKSNINVTFIASKQFTDGVQNYSDGGFGRNIYGTFLTGGTLEHNGNTNVSIGGTSVNTNLTHSLYGSFVRGGTYTAGENNVRTLYFGAKDEIGQLVAYTSDKDHQFKASFANFDKVVVREGSSLYIGDYQTAKYYHPGSTEENAMLGTDAENDDKYNGAIMSYGGKLIMPANTELVIEQGASMHVKNLTANDNSSIYLANTSQLNINGNSTIAGTIDSSGGNIALDKDATLSINQLTNTDKATTLTLNSANTDQVTIDNMENKKSDESKPKGSLSVNLTSNAAAQLSGSTAVQLLTSAMGTIDIDNESTNKGYQLHVAESALLGELSAQVDDNGVLDPNSIREKSNEVVAELTDIGFNNFQVFRSQMNDLDKRMGDLRTMPQASGAWARALAGQSKYKSTHNNYKTLQAGVDYRMGNFFGGVMASYTDGDGSVKMGDTDDKNYSFGLYGGWLADNGQFIDITIKRHHLESEYDLRYRNGEKAKGSYHTAGTSISAEYGWRLPITNTNFYIEPQVEFMYGHLNSVGYTTSNGVRVNQSAGKTAVGRLGAAFGYVSPDKSGSAYIKASVLNDWEGDAKTRVSKGSISRYYHDDMGGTWGEFAIGGTYNLSKDWSIYGEAETTAGNPVRTTYQFSAGVRYSF